jgi:hypothetical protein
MSANLKVLKNPYSRNSQLANVEMPIENPLKELQEDELLKIQGGLYETDWVEVIITSVVCAGASYFLGNPGHVCTLSVECQKSCNKK